MTIALKKVFTQISRMPANEQEAIAGLLEKELSWQKSFSKTQKQTIRRNPRPHLWRGIDGVICFLLPFITQCHTPIFGVPACA